MTEPAEVKYFENRAAWRAWLAENFETAKQVWFIFPLKSSGIQGVLYNDAVEEALCFGWIDSTVRALDSERKIQRFTPRKPGSTYSQPNRERLGWLMDHKMVHPKLERKIQAVLSEPFLFPDDIVGRLREEAAVWSNYLRFSDPYKRIRIAYIEAARVSPQEFEKRLNNFIAKTRENKMVPGYGRIEKYYQLK